MWFRKPKTPPVPIRAAEGFTLGQLVQHKVSGGKAVIVKFYASEQSGRLWATVARGDFGNDEIDCVLCEIEAYVPPAATP